MEEIFGVLVEPQYIQQGMNKLMSLIGDDMTDWIFRVKLFGYEPFEPFVLRILAIHRSYINEVCNAAAGDLD
jgi:hypothetical protein